MRAKSAFTLIELSIVLVIIGLLVGGVLVGRDLIDAANMRKDMGTIEKWSAAVNTFKLKYNAVPGDLSNPTQFGFDATSAGDGNGKIQLISGYNGNMVVSLDFTYPAEWFWVSHHLGKAGLVELSGDYGVALNNVRSGIYYPKIYSSSGGAGHDESGGVTGGIILSYEENNRVSEHYFRFGAVPYPWAVNPYVIFSGGFSPAKAKQFDSKFDDGKPLSGSITIGPISELCPDDIYDTSTAGCVQGGIGTSATWFHCALLTTEDYDTTYDKRSCSLRVKASF